MRLIEIELANRHEGPIVQITMSRSLAREIADSFEQEPHPHEVRYTSDKVSMQLSSFGEEPMELARVAFFPSVEDRPALEAPDV
jgi:hypothetical protein